MPFPHTFYCSLLLLFFLCHLVSAARYFLPLVKDLSKTHIYTTFLVGTPPVRVYVAVDIGNKYSWLACDLVGYNKSSTFAAVPCDTVNWTCDGCDMCTGPKTPTCTYNSCGAFVYGPRGNGYDYGLIDDTISIYSCQAPHASRKPLDVRDCAPSKPALVPKFQFTCTGEGALKGLSHYTKGLVTLSRTPTALHEQISSSLKVPRKFALCVPSSAGTNGAIYFGGGPYVLPPRGVDMSKYFVTTTLVVNPHSTAPAYRIGEASVEYFINLSSIKIDGTPLKFDSVTLPLDKEGRGGAKISTLEFYTTLHSNIYKPFVDLFVNKAATLKLVKVAPVAPFGACFSSRSIRYNAKTGKGLPVIDLVMNETSALLHGKKARWRIYGSNSMVRVARDVHCLAFVDGGDSPAIVIGVKQLEDNLVEFDLVANKLRFTSSLLRLGTNCSQFKGI